MKDAFAQAVAIIFIICATLVAMGVTYKFLTWAFG